MRGRTAQESRKARPAEHGRHVFWFKGLRSEGAATGGNGAAIQNQGIPDIREVRKGCSIMLDELARERGDEDGYELSLLIVADEEIRILNRDHRGLDKPTDVLSFPLIGEGPPGAASHDGAVEEDRAHASDTSASDFAPAFWVPGAVPIGDVVIARETCEAQARAVGHSVRDEFWRLLVHGILHLFGYDHETSTEDERRMQAREDELLEQLAHARL